MTFSLVARSADGSQWGVAVASKFLAVGAAVPAAQVGVGALATQAIANLTYRRGGPHVSGRWSGFDRAFFAMPRPPPGPGCAISPYQETDLIFGLDAAAIGAAVRRLGPSRSLVARG